MIRAIIFDMNGIIIDDEHIHELAFQKTVAEYKINLTHNDYLECCAGKTDAEGYESIANKFFIQLPIKKLINKKNQIYLELFPKQKKSYPGIIDLIYSLSTKFILALTSSSSRAEVDLITNEFNIADKFSITISADEVIRGKPNPEPYIITAKKLDLKPNECVVIEDSKSGVASAKSANCYCIGVTTTHNKDDLKNADLIVDDFYSIDENIITNFNKKYHA